MNIGEFLRALSYIGMAVLVGAGAGCGANQHYRTTPTGQLKGTITVTWIEPDLFVFRPDSTNPLTFTRANGDVIRPGPMVTDGGSIPRMFWSIPGYSPWGYAPAFMVHDWIFEAHQCSYDNLNYQGDTVVSGYSVDEAADTMSEVLKTMRESDDSLGMTKLVIYTMDLAVRSSFARRAWDGPCEQIPEGTFFDPTDEAREVPPDLRAFDLLSIDPDNTLRVTPEREIYSFSVTWPPPSE